MSETDRIEKKVVLRAPLSRVWRAVADAKEFGTWFGMEVDGTFSAGATLDATIRPTKVDPEIAKTQEPYSGTPFRLVVERVEPERLLSFRWHPGAVEASADEPMTLVVFQLAEVAGGVLLTITESGFDRVPLARRAQAFAENEKGWTGQLMLIEKYLAQAA